MKQSDVRQGEGDPEREFQSTDEGFHRRLPKSLCRDI